MPNLSFNSVIIHSLNFFFQNYLNAYLNFVSPCYSFHNFVYQSMVCRCTLCTTVSLLFLQSHCSSIQHTGITFYPVQSLHYLLFLCSWSILHTGFIHFNYDYAHLRLKMLSFGWYWFNYCSTDTEPLETINLIEPGMCLCFGTLPQSF